jgi:hypothetical protein
VPSQPVGARNRSRAGGRESITAGELAAGHMNRVSRACTMLPGRTADQYDAYSVARWLSRADHDSTLAAFLEPGLTPSERTVAEVERSILGVAGSPLGS